MAVNSPVVKTVEIDQDAVRAREIEVSKETDAEIVERLRKRFTILDEMTTAVKKGIVRAMIVSGPPGVGKSFGVEKVLQKQDLFNTIAGKKPKYEIVRGNMSALGLYAKLYEYSGAGNVVVFDDCDDVLMDQLSLNILKGALDSGARRFINWNLDSRLLRREGIPDRFEFKGSAIFITNLKFEFIRSKKLRAHLQALESRCHYIDLQMDTNREKLLRMRDVIETNGMFDRYDFEPGVNEEILEFVASNQHRLREMSLRMALKIADLRSSFVDSWKSMAETTCMIK